MGSLLALRIGGPSVLSSLAITLDDYINTEVQLKDLSALHFPTAADSIKDLAEHCSWK